MAAHDGDRKHRLWAALCVNLTATRLRKKLAAILATTRCCCPPGELQSRRASASSLVAARIAGRLRWCRGPFCAGASHRRYFPSPSCAATARSSEKSSTCCAAARTAQHVDDFSELRAVAAHDVLEIVPWRAVTWMRLFKDAEPRYHQASAWPSAVRIKQHRWRGAPIRLSHRRCCFDLTLSLSCQFARGDARSRCAACTTNIATPPSM